MNISKEEKKIEAVARMEALGIFPETIKQFGAADYVSISEPPLGAFYWAEGEDLDRIRYFEGQYNALVYMVVRSFTGIGKMDAYLYVSDYAEEWGLDWDGLKEMGPLAYVYNHDMPDCSEFGCIGIELSAAAGLLRTWQEVQICQDIQIIIRMSNITSPAESAGWQVRQGQQAISL